MTTKAKFGAYVTAVASVLVIALAEIAFHAPIDDKSRFLVMLIPVAVSTWMGGKGPGLVGLALSSLVGASLLPPKYSLAISSPSDVVSLILYVIASLVLIGIIESLNRSQAALADSSAKIGSLNIDLKASLEAKEGALLRQKRFTSDASHELKTPLTAIRARSGIALSNEEDSGELIEHIAAINRAAEVMTSVVQDLLLLAASDEGQLTLCKEQSSLLVLVEDALASVQVGNHCFCIDLDPNVEAECDPSAITRVLVNLLQNSILHTPIGKCISVMGESSPNLVTLNVRDEGNGIPADHLGRIFDRFHRVDSSRNRESGGSGLGLAIAKAIVEAHGGSISLQSSVGIGTTVSISLPK